MTIFKLSTPQLQALVRQRAANKAGIFFSRHVELRMKERGINRLEVVTVLAKGLMRRKPEPNLGLGTLECRMEYYLAGRDLGVVVALDDDDPGLLVVTAIVLGAR